jgi:hypothetical protein
VVAIRFPLQATAYVVVTSANYCGGVYVTANQTSGKVEHEDFDWANKHPITSLSLFQRINNEVDSGLRRLAKRRAVRDYRSMTTKPMRDMPLVAIAIAVAIAGALCEESDRGLIHMRQ